MNAYTKKELAEIFSDKELLAKLAGEEFNAEAHAALKEKGIELSEEEIAAIQEILMKVKTGKITKEQLEKLGFTVLPSDTNFLFAKTPDMDGGQLYELLKTKGILVRHFTNPKISQFNRITIGTREQMEKLINTLKEVLL